jgi:hypothetical protein
MAKYYVQTLVTFGGEVEADSEQKGWDWEDELLYEGVYEIQVEKQEDED